MANKVKFVICLHSHQPVGNFDKVFEEVYNQSYFPFVNMFKKFPEISVSLHYSGPLLEWLYKNKKKYILELQKMTETKQVELIGGAFYEPILSLLPSKDRIDQINYTKQFFKKKLKAEPVGFWLAERVWEQSLVKDLKEAKVEFTMVDDTHFSYGGIEGVPSGYYLAEDRGKVIKIFPLNEQLRYLIPFAEPEKTIEYLKTFLEKPENEAIVIYGDDGEKFGSWPGTYNLMYKEMWLLRFLELLEENSDWLEVTSFKNIISNYGPVSLAYLPDSSYREMMKWVLNPKLQYKLENLYKENENNKENLKFIRGGSYRNFRKKYQESYNMYCRMIEFSKKAKTSLQKQYLHKAQCNCAYWHGVFGGIYLPHLRNAVYENIIEGEKLLYEGIIRVGEYDIDNDGHQEYSFVSNFLKIIIDANKGGRIISFDLRKSNANIAATFSRKEEPYHKYVTEGAKETEMAGVHDIPKLKEDNLEEYLVYDKYDRYSLIEHFFDKIPTADDIEKLNFKIKKEFIERKLKGTKHKNKLELIDPKFGLNKKFQYGEKYFKVNYNLENTDLKKYLAIEWNLFTLSPDAPDKWFGVNGQFLGNAGFKGETEGNNLSFTDEWRKFKINFQFSENLKMIFSPLYTINLSESGIEKIFQNSTIFFIFNTEKTKNIELSITCE